MLQHKTFIMTFSACFVFLSIPVSAACPSADLTGDCKVDFEDLAVLISQWLTSGPIVPNDMVYIPSGTFQMGDCFNEGDSDELPVHTVTLDSFYMGKYEITNGQYCDFLNSALNDGTIYVSFDLDRVFRIGTEITYCEINPISIYSQIDYSNGVFTVRSKNGRSMVNDPMIMVSWYGAVAYCNWRSLQEGYEECYINSFCDFSKHGYRLATEAQWEYAARGGLSNHRFPWGDTITHNNANYWSDDYYSYDTSPTREYHPTWNDGIYPYTSPVGGFAANNFGLYDMAGNVFEWCNDWYSSSYYSSSPTNNPTGPTSGSHRILRSSWWGGFAYNCRAAFRGGFEILYPGGCGHYLGFRVVLNLN